MNTHPICHRCGDPARHVRAGQWTCGACMAEAGGLVTVSASRLHQLEAELEASQDTGDRTMLEWRPDEESEIVWRPKRHVPDLPAGRPVRHRHLGGFTAPLSRREFALGAALMVALALIVQLWAR